MSVSSWTRPHLSHGIPERTRSGFHIPVLLLVGTQDLHDHLLLADRAFLAESFLQDLLMDARLDKVQDQVRSLVLHCARDRRELLFCGHRSCAVDRVEGFAQIFVG